MKFFERSLNNTLWQVLLLLIILLILGWFSISTLVFWSPDTGLRYLQVRELIDKQWQSTWVDYPAHVLDPELKYVPYYYAFIVVGAQIFLEISSFFPLLASLLFPVVGRLGLVIPPVVGGMASCIAIYRLARLTRLQHSAFIMWVVVLATPVLFYSIEFWDHTFVLAFSLWSVYFLARGLGDDGRGNMFVAGIMASMAWIQRAEYAVFVIALAFSWLIVSRLKIRPMLVFAWGNLVGALPLFIVQYHWIGHPLGVTYAPVLFGYGAHDVFTFPEGTSELGSTRTLIISRLLTYIEARDPVTFLATIFCLIGFVLLVFVLRVPHWRKKWLLLSGLTISAIGYVLWLVAVSQFTVTGLIPTFALLPFGLAYIEEHYKDSSGGQIYSLVFVSTLLFLALMLVLWPAYGGNQWGSRYLLPVYPLLVYLAFYAFEYYWRSLPELRTILRTTFVSLLLLSVLIQVAGIRLLFMKHQYEIEVREQLQALSTDLIMTNSPFLPSHMSSVDKMFLYVSSESDFYELAPRMWENGVYQFAVAQVVGIPLPVPDRVGDITIREVKSFIYELEGPLEMEGGLQR